ncbi:DUF4190 domain-containing protein [Rhodococcus sp. IEGM 1408]|uniref:DUF4190 domain-containing protein n=1 Tax=Rhodococcus sp. IEGM 1408 TaxID=3082220 RepID=UPI00295488AC|nr:DUF4190 domain-containing protein [Rhodococcus sp. IEGM 1408]MDV8000988.1 DUF4190 domain-containing protein [Rhodococcus sp. IEGM 1408]
MSDWSTVGPAGTPVPGDDPGTDDPGPDPHGGPRPVNRTALAAVVLAVGNVVFGSFLGLFLPVFPAVFAVVSVALGHVALFRVRRSGESGRGLALTALAVSYVWLAVMASVVFGMLLFTGYAFAVLGF